MSAAKAIARYSKALSRASRTWASETHAAKVGGYSARNRVTKPSCKRSQAAAIPPYLSYAAREAATSLTESLLRCRLRLARRCQLAVPVHSLSFSWIQDHPSFLFASLATLPLPPSARPTAPLPLSTDPRPPAAPRNESRTAPFPTHLTALSLPSSP
jgi:hypothetical protein